MRIHYKKELVQKSLPEGFIHPTQSRKYLQASFATKIQLLGESPKLGALCDFGWIGIEYFTGEVEPEKSTKKGLGLQIWHSVGEKKRPSGWLALPTLLRRSTIALLDVQNLSQEYWLDWSENVRRQRKNWYAQKNLCISEATKENFMAAYRESTISPSLQSLFLKSIERHVTVYQEDVHFLVVQEKESEKIIAGFMTVDDFATNQTFYPVAFILPIAKKTAASVGLMEHWIQNTQKKGLRFINLGIVWMPGDPPSWKGYSQFKAFFKPQIVIFTKPLIRFFWNY